jgi:hypothetical protein
MKVVSVAVRSDGLAALFAICLCLFQPAMAQKPASSEAAPPPKSPNEIRQLWTANVTSMLAKPIPSSSADAYYAGEQLMVPLHAAFQRKDAAWEQEFADHFLRLSQTHVPLTDVTLSRLQYLYLASQFMVLAKNSGHPELVPKGMPDFIVGEVRKVWYDEPAPQYAHAPFKGARARVLFKLENKNLGKNFYRAILDAEFFMFAIAGDIRNYYGFERAAGETSINDILAIALRTCQQEIVHTSSGGWVLQPGVFSDHPDFQFAGNPGLRPGLRPAPVQSIGWDSSHFARWALFIRSLIDAYPPDSREHSYYSQLERELNTQFFDKVVVPPSPEFSCYRMNNFMDGTNGVYRYGYKSMGENNGYGPYGNSGALLTGWWGFLESDQSHAMYHKMADQFPWSEQCVDLYLGPTFEGVKRPKADLDPNTPVMKYRYLLTRFASEL